MERFKLMEIEKFISLLENKKSFMSIYFLKKGSQVYLEGQLRTNKYTDQAGIEKYSTEIHLTNYNSEFKMLDSKSDNQILNSPNVDNSSTTKSTEKNLETFDIEDDVPF